MNKDFNKLQYFSEGLIILFLYLILFITGTVVILTTHSGFGGGDNYVHYEFAHWGWKHPELLFDHWGKPVFTILSSPFAQFGINGIRFYNLLIGLLTSFFAFKTVKLLKIKFPYLIIGFVVITPIYFASIFSALTEVTFSCFIMLGIYLFFKNKFIFSAIAFSFLPIIRTESIVIIPAIVLAFICKKKYLSLIFLSAGFILLSFFGRTYYDNNFFWLITEMPYTGGTEGIYGKGSLFHFIFKAKEITGYALGIMCLAGIFLIFYKYFISKREKKNEILYFILLIVLPFVLFFSAHSFVWWQGMGNSLGLVRVMAAITPLAAIIALFFWSSLFNKTKTSIVFVLNFALLIFILIGSIKINRNGFKVSGTQDLVLKAVNFVNDVSLDTNKVYYYDPLVTVALNLDPYDQTACQCCVRNYTNPSSVLENNAIVIWDAHYGPNEGRLPLENLMNDNNLVLIKSFFPENPFTVLGGYPYAIYIFQKTTNKELLDNSLLTQSIPLKINITMSPDSSLNIKDVSYYKIDTNNVFIPFYEINCNNLKTDYNIILDVKGDILITNKNIINPIIVASVNKNNHDEYYSTFSPINNEYISFENNINKWMSFSHSFLIPSGDYNDAFLKIYFWNKNKDNLFFKDLSVNLKYSN